ncbi:MAG: CPBP family intramembrane metalloprotease [Bdellovibrionales bacterium]|nr:CPBP family intramembrane metalloprotease [Bdellovibrionales bacterium]
MREDFTSTRAQVVRIAVFGEGLLLIIALPWFLLRSHHFTFLPLREQLLESFLITLPLLALNYLLDLLVRRFGLFPSLADFRDAFLYPLSQDLLVRDILVIALFSGFGEELLFRGVLTYEASQLIGPTLGILVVSSLFAYVHLIGMAKKYLFLLFLYFGVGIYFNYFSWFDGHIFSVCLSHALFNFCSLLFLRKAAGDQLELPQEISANTQA